MKNEHYDVGIYGLWYGRNYGSMITYYALDEVIKSLGYTTVMIRNPLGNENIDLLKLERSHPLIFADRHYNITPMFKLDEMANLNQICNCFLLGSDQMWNYHLSRPYKQTYFFDFVDEEKNKIAYATSFGQEKYLGPDEEKKVTEKNLHRFNSISVRDDFSQKILLDDFNISAKVNLDPVFLCDKEKYEELANAINLPIEEQFVFAYILDPNPQIGEELKKISKSTNRQIVVIFNELNVFKADPNQIKEKMGVNREDFIFLTDATLAEWLWCFKNCDLVITDSFHGTCFSIIFNKGFIVRKNVGRGGKRFEFLLKELALNNQLVQSPQEFSYQLEKMGDDYKLDYTNTMNILKAKKEEALNWLKNALENKKVGNRPAIGKIKEENIVMNLHPDIERARTLVALVKAYGFKQIVISSGTRNLSLARLFEADDFFETYNVTDERSAAYFAIGLSNSTQQPVVITCTSGTAVTNYLPGITEAFYQKIPIVIITGDRYPCYIGQMEAQMIKQYGIFSDVSKKSVTLPIGNTSRDKWECYRKICETLLEVDHHGKGPVHINFPIDIIEHNPPAPETLVLPIVKKIDRIDFNSSESIWKDSFELLKRAKRIMVIYGQNTPLSKEDKMYFDQFTEKYNCVVLTDHLSNVHGTWCLNPYRLLKKWTNDQFKRNLMPDLVIYVGGKRTLNCPLQGKMRSIIRRINFWHITDDGNVADIYGKLTTVFECSQSWFFKHFASIAGNIRNDGRYYKLWKNYLDEITPVDLSKVGFTSFYTMGKFALNIPKNSFLHLGVGNTFINIENYPLDESIIVYCNMGTNGIDGSASSFIGQCVKSKQKGFLLIGDLSFFYDMNSLWNKKLNGNVRILLNNDSGAGLLSHYQSPSITHEHHTKAEGWVKSLGFKYMSANNKDEFNEKLDEFLNGDSIEPVFFEVFTIRR